MLAFELAVDAEIAGLAAPGGLRNNAGHGVLDAPVERTLKEKEGRQTEQYVRRWVYQRPLCC